MPVALLFTYVYIFPGLCYYRKVANPDTLRFQASA
jgi:hypothetical protein